METKPTWKLGTHLYFTTGGLAGALGRYLSREEARVEVWNREHGRRLIPWSVLSDSDVIQKTDLESETTGASTDVT